MMSDGKNIRVDLDELATLWSELKSASGTLSHVAASVGRIVDAIGHRELEGKVREFATLWEKTRGALIVDMDTMGGNLKAIEETLRSTDSELKKALDGSRS